MKKLSKFFIRSFVGPFLITFFISMFMLIMQFLWKYIDDLMGKGLPIHVILELLFYVSASLLPLALPLAILLSSLMVMGNLGESNELTALKSSGLSLYRILRPLATIILLISIATFYFSNYVIPVANYKWHALIWDIQEKKMSNFIQPDQYSQAIDGLSIKVDAKKGNKFKGIIIHDLRDKNVLKTIVADSGEFFQSVNQQNIFLKLYNGQAIQETLDASKRDSKGNTSVYPSRKTTFKTATYKIPISGFNLQHSRASLFKDQYEMMNVFQINEVEDSLQLAYEDLMNALVNNTKSKHPYFRAITIEHSKMLQEVKHANDTLENRKKTTKKPQLTKRERKILSTPPIYNLNKMNLQLQKKVIHRMEQKLKASIKSVKKQKRVIVSRHHNLRRYEIEFHRKFALSFAIIVLFFVGAPLGAIIKKGGFGAPVVIAALLFMIYFVLISIGDTMARNFIISPFFGMWGPSFILIPFAIALMFFAANDRSLKLPSLKRKKRKKDA